MALVGISLEAVIPLADNNYSMEDLNNFDRRVLGGKRTKRDHKGILCSAYSITQYKDHDGLP